MYWTKEALVSSVQQYNQTGCPEIGFQTYCKKPSSPSLINLFILTSDIGLMQFLWIYFYHLCNTSKKRFPILKWHIKQPMHLFLQGKTTGVPKCQAVLMNKPPADPKSCNQSSNENWWKLDTLQLTSNTSFNKALWSTNTFSIL